MKASLLDYLACPFCHSPLRLEVSARAGDIIEAGAVQCPSCGDSYPIRGGIPDMLCPRLAGIDLKLREVRGWVAMASKDGWYEPDDRVDLALPYVVEKLGWDPRGAAVWVATRTSFERLLNCYVRPGMRVLEVGAAKTWAGRYFIQRGCRYTACDLVGDANIGVGRSRFFTERFGHYEAVVADAEQLPFADGSFDLVYGVAALHHALDLRRMVGQMARVARRGAVVAGLNEGVRSYRAGAEAGVQGKEKQFGINEHVHTLGDYRAAFRRGGLRIAEMTLGLDRAGAGPKGKLGRLIDALQRIPRIGGPMATWLTLGLLLPYGGVTIFARKP
ncbi:MAG: methyltransferase domain-containing protein [Phycisphaerae bacterium]